MNTELRLQNLEEARILLGPLDRTAKLIRKTFDVDLVHRGEMLKVIGDENDVASVRAIFDRVLQKLRRGHPVAAAEIERMILDVPEASPERGRDEATGRVQKKYAGVSPRTQGQKHLLRAMESHPIVFAIGPAGTGKTYLAVAHAVSCLRAGLCSRIVLVRPAVEAGEKLGFLPGDFQAKINPYLRPIYDALGELLDPPILRRYMETDIIEICPLAFMRGRTLNHAFIILDEAQNTTISQMRMFLTRMGENSAIVVTGDLTQVDLPKGVPSGLVDAVERLTRVSGLTVVRLESCDIVRHPAVKSIVEAYERSQTHMPSPEDREANPVRAGNRRRRH